MNRTTSSISPVEQRPIVSIVPYRLPAVETLV
jgi:hypothetical protein